MALSRVQTVLTYKSSRGGQEYVWDIVINEQSASSVRNIRGPRGLITDSMTGVPEEVLQDMYDSVDLAQLLTTESSVTSGTETFNGQASRTVAVAPGLLNNTDYRVQVTTPDGTPMRVENKTITSFLLVAPSTYGAVGDEKDVDWAILVSTSAASALGGTLTFAQADNSSKTVTFTSALPTATYRVLLEPSGFFPVRVTSKTKTGFTVALGIELQPAETVDVGYDVVV